MEGNCFEFVTSASEFLRHLFFHHVMLVIYVKQMISDLTNVLLSNCPWLILVVLYTLRTYVPLMFAHIINSLFKSNKSFAFSRFKLSTLLVLPVNKGSKIEVFLFTQTLRTIKNSASRFSVAIYKSIIAPRLET
jgi:hypothetical protein